MGNVKCANCVGLMAQDDLQLSPSEYGEAQVSARRTGVTSLNIQGTGANLGDGLVAYVQDSNIPTLNFAKNAKFRMGHPSSVSRIALLSFLRLNCHDVIV